MAGAALGAVGGRAAAGAAAKGAAKAAAKDVALNAVGNIASSGGGGGGGGGMAGALSTAGSMLPGPLAIPGAIVGGMIGGAADYGSMLAKGGYKNLTGAEALTGVPVKSGYLGYNFGGASVPRDASMGRRSSPSMPQAYGPGGTYNPGRGYSGGGTAAPTRGMATQPSVGAGGPIQASHTPMRPAAIAPVRQAIASPARPALSAGRGGGGGVIDVASRTASRFRP